MWVIQRLPGKCSELRSLTSVIHNYHIMLQFFSLNLKVVFLSPFGSLSPGRLLRTSSVSLWDVFSARQINTRVLLSRSAASHGHEHELRNHLFSELTDAQTHNLPHLFYTNSLSFIYITLWSIMGPRLPRSVCRAPSKLPLRRKSSVATVTR